jgi:MFS family permease
MAVIALTWILYQMTGSAVALGLMGLMKAVPMIILSLIGGGIADRFDRKRIILTAQILLTMISLGTLGAATSDILTPWMIYIITFLQNAIGAFARPARQSLLPHLVEKKDFGKAVQLSTTMWQTTVLLGPALGGFLMRQIGPLALLVIDCVSFIPFIACIIKMRTTSTAVVTNTVGNLTSLIDGMRYVLQKRIIIGTMILDFFVSFFSMAKSVFPLYADQMYQTSREAYSRVS